MNINVTQLRDHAKSLTYPWIGIANPSAADNEGLIVLFSAHAEGTIIRRGKCSTENWQIGDRVTF